MWFQLFEFVAPEPLAEMRYKALLLASWNVYMWNEVERRNKIAPLASLMLT